MPSLWEERLTTPCKKYDKALLDKFESLPVKRIVVSGNRDFKPKQGYIRSFTPEDAIRLETKTLVSSGSMLNLYLLSNELIDRIVINKLNKKLGHGVKPFDIGTKDFPGVPISEEHEEGIKLVTYRVFNADFVN